MPSNLSDKLRDEIRDCEARAAEARRDLAELLGIAGEDVRPVAIADALAEPKPAEEWVITGLLASKGIGLLAAEGGIGKSTLAAQLCAGLSAGTGFFGFNAGAPIPTLFLEGEGSREKFVERIGVALARLQIQAQGLPLYIQPRTWRPSLNGTTADTIRVCGARLVVMDTIGLFQRFDENSATEFKALIINPLRKLGDETGAGFLLIHHTGKPSEMRKGRHTVRGTSAFVDDVDLAMRLEAPDGDKGPYRRLCFDKVRHGQPQDDVGLEYDFSTATFRLADPAAREEQEADERRAKERTRIEQIRQRVVAELKKEPLDLETLQKIVNVRRADVAAALQSLADDKRIYHEAAGRNGRQRVWRVFADVR